ncbi:MAG TPA: family 16 glycoside hydrolase [Candidatus Limnocylindrales bacterium]|nr:family 16 glycoside hydrolase [Candidatus Limnocylindrales bacterium]
MNQPHRFDNPFPGLRSFAPEEDHLFFGREEQTMELLQKLATHRFVAVVGTSGSGKSSLVRCGLLSQLLGGKMLQAGTRWAVAVTHPGGAPLLQLTESLLAADLYDAAEEDAKPRLLATLSRSHFGLVEAVRQARLAENTNFVLVVDQFEELFRFNRDGNTQREAANEFVSLLLQAAAQKEVPIYIVLTMRSDFIGDCAQFENLAEAVNQGEYLIPRMTREQFKQAIEGPIRVAGGTLTARLLQRLLNDVGEQPDQLPCLQHALMRTWDQWKRSSAEIAGQEPVSHHENPDAVEPSQISNLKSQISERALDLEDYDAVGRMREALSRHADEIFEALPSAEHRTALVRIFKALTERGPDGRGIRRPTTLRQLVAIAGVEQAVVRLVIEAYRAPGVSFLTPPVSSALGENTVIDISHESLMRIWGRLRLWVEEEAQSARVYRRLQETAALHGEKRAGLYHDPDLQIALSWRETTQPNAAWAEPYGGGFEPAMRFLDQSREAAERDEQEREAARQRELERARQFAEAQAKIAGWFKRFAGSLAVGLCLAVALTLWAFKLRSEANLNRAKAEQQTQKTKEALVASNHEQGNGRLAMAKSRLVQHDIFAAKIIGASAIGFSGFGREQQGAEFAQANPDLLRPGSEERGEVARLLRGQPDFMRLWASPVAGHHQAGILGLNLSPDGRTLISADGDGMVKVWNVESGNLRSTFRAHESVAWGKLKIDLSPDGRWLATAGSDRTIKIWDTTTWEQRCVLTNHLDAVVAICFSPDGKTLVSASRDADLKLWETGAFALKRTLEGLPPGEEKHLVFSADGRFLLATDWGSEHALLWQLQNGEAIRSGLDLNAQSAAFSPDGRWLAIVRQNEQHEVSLLLFGWETDAAIPKLIWVGSQPLTNRTDVLAFSPDSQTLACGIGPMIYRFKLPDLGQLPPTKGIWWSIAALAFKPDGDGLFAAGGPNSTIRYFEMPSGHSKAIAGAHVAGSCQAAFSPDGRFIASTAGDGDVRLWNVANGRSRIVFQGPAILGQEHPAPIFRPDGALLASAWEDGTIRLSDPATGAERGILRGHKGPVLSLAAHPAGQGFVSAGQDGSLRFWSWDEKELLRIRESGEPVRAIAFSPGGAVLAFALDPGKEIELWDWAHKKPSRPPLKGQTGRILSLAFSPDNALLASGGRPHGETILWDLRSGTPIQRWYEDEYWEDAHVAFTADGRHFVRGLANSVEWYELNREQGVTSRQLAVMTKRVHDPMTGIALSPDGRLLVTSHIWYGLELWDVSRGKEAMEWSNPDGDAFSGWGADLSPDGSLLATGTRDGFIRTWDLATGRLLDSLKADESLRQDLNLNSANNGISAMTPFAPSADPVSGVRFSHDGQRLYAVYGHSGLITSWEFKDGWHLFESAANGPAGGGFSLELSHDGSLLATVTEGTVSSGTVRIWDARHLGDRPLTTFHPTGASCTFHPTRPLLAVSGDVIRVYDLSDPHKPRKVLDVTDSITGGYVTVKYSCDGKYLTAYRPEGPECLFDAGTGKLVRSCRGPSNLRPWSCDFSPDGRWLAVGEQGKLVRLWDVQTGAPVAVLPGHSDWVRRVQFTPDSRRLVSLCSESVRVWDLDQLLHESLDYASFLKDFHIEDDKVVGIGSNSTNQITSTNLYQCVFHPFHASSGRSLLGILDGTENRTEQDRKLFWQYYRAQNLHSAQALLDELECTNRAPEECEALVGLYRIVSRSNLRDQNLPLAMHQIESAIALAPDDFENWKTKAEILEQEQNFDLALPAVDRALQLSPRSGEAWALKAGILGRLSQDEASAQAWTKAIDLAPERDKMTYLAMSQAGKPTPQTPDDNGWIALFDGRTLSGWTAPDPSRWEIKNGMLVGSGTRSHLFSPYTYTNLEFRAEVKVGDGGNGGMFFRAAYHRGWGNLGYEAQLANNPPDWEQQKTGSLYGFQPKKDKLVEDNTWFTQHVIAIGNRIIIKVNDQIVTDFVDEKNTYTSGHLALQQFGTTAEPNNPSGSLVITYRNVMVKPLPDDPQAAWAEVRKDIPQIQ